MNLLNPIFAYLAYIFTFLQSKKISTTCENFKNNSNYSSEKIFKWLHGVFDNFDQIKHEEKYLKDLSCKHDYVSANFSYHPYYVNTMIVSYYYEKNTSNVFRFRYYEFHKMNKTSFWGNRNNYIMKVYRPKIETIQKLKLYNYDLDKYLPSLDEFDYLDTCDLIWASRIFSYRGILKNGKAEITSQYNPNTKLYVQDDLTLWENNLFVNDKVFDKNGLLIIGTKNGVPYKLKRITM